MKEYEVISIKERLLGTIFLGSSKMDTDSIKKTLNEYADKGWEMVSQFIEHNRILFWNREILIITFKREK